MIKFGQEIPDQVRNDACSIFEAHNPLSELVAFAKVTDGHQPQYRKNSGFRIKDDLPN